MSNALDLAWQYHIGGHLDQAARGYQEVLAWQPDNADALHLLGVVDLQQGNISQAISRIGRAITIKDSVPEFHTNLAEACRRARQYYHAAECCRTALLLRPQHAQAANTLGLILLDQGQVADAAAQFRSAVEVEPSWALAHNNLGNALRLLGDRLRAILEFRKSVALAPTFAIAHSNLGQLLLDEGQLTESLAHCAEAVRLEPARHAGAYNALARLLLGRLPETNLREMQEMLASSYANSAERLSLQFSLASVLDGQGEYESAALHLERANAAAAAEWRQRSEAYDPAAHSQFVTNMLAVCTPELFARVRGMGLATERPVFVFGLPRSGTSLVEQILASHSQVFGAGELDFSFDDFAELSGPLVYSPGRGEVNGANRQVGCETGGFANLRQLDRETIARVASGHLQRLYMLDASAARVTDKMPDNYLYLGMLAALFPCAQFIHCRRDLRDVAASCWLTNFRDIRWANDPEHIASRFHEYQRLMNHWSRVLPVRILEIDYEETVADLETVARRLVTWCGLTWEPHCLAFHETVRPVRTASESQVRKPIYTKSVGRWKNYEASLSHLFARLNCIRE